MSLLSQFPSAIINHLPPPWRSSARAAIARSQPSGECDVRKVRFAHTNAMVCGNVFFGEEYESIFVRLCAPLCPYVSFRASYVPHMCRSAPLTTVPIFADLCPSVSIVVPLCPFLCPSVSLCDHRCPSVFSPMRPCVPSMSLCFAVRSIPRNLFWQALRPTFRLDVHQSLMCDFARPAHWHIHGHPCSVPRTSAT